MNNQIKYKFFLIIAFSLLLVLLAALQTYALFETNSTGSANIDIGNWVILLNGNDVTETNTITLNNFVYANGSHTESGYFAPGSSAYFDLVLDASESDVSVQYEIDIDDTSIADYENIYFSVTDMASNTPLVTNTYSGIIRLNDVNKVVTLRLTLVWDNQSEYDESDTSLIDGELAFTINANFEQYTGE